VVKAVPVVYAVSIRRAAQWLAVAALCALAACKPAPPAAGAVPGVADAPVATPVTITALIWAPDWPDEMEQVAAEFTRLNPDVKVDVQFMIGNSVEENLKPKVASRNLPDLMSVNPNAYAAELADQGVLADVGESLAWQRLRPGLKADWMSPNGKRFGIAGGVAATLIYYNKTMFRQAGITSAPVDFSEFLDDCERLKKAGHTPLHWSGGFPNLIANGAFSFGFANNIVPTTPDWKARIADGTLALDNAAGADIFAKIQTVAQRGYTQPNLMQSGYDEGIVAFVEGRTAMAFQGTWAAGSLMHPRGFEVGVFVPPWNARGAASVPVLGSETGFAVGETANKAAAMRFLEYVTGAGFAIQQKKRRNIAPFAQSGGAQKGDPAILAYLAQIERAPVTGSPYYSMLPANTIDLLHQLIQDVLSNRLTPRQAAQRLEASIRDEARSNNK
jgi:multiple sugar transport system substrate-binding protein/raffinose/stachyose/melibiose transport system substrate-binding protein